MAQRTESIKSVYLMTSVSKHDNATRYYIKYGGNRLKRTTKKRYDYVKEKAVRLDCFLTQSNQKNTHWHHSVTAYLTWREYHYLGDKG